ncbi:DUF4064 domain-containing protein [Rummeliibacillus sp. JY-2-4R]
MKRTVEVVFGIIGSLFNVIAIAFLGIMLAGMSQLKNNTQIQDELVTQFENEFSKDPQFQEVDVQSFSDSMMSVINSFGPLGWFINICFIISFVLGIIAMVSVVRAKEKKANFAGAMFIVAGVLAGILSPTSIIYYIAAIICFVRKPKIVELTETDSTYIEQA